MFSNNFGVKSNNVKNQSRINLYNKNSSKVFSTKLEKVAEYKITRSHHILFKIVWPLIKKEEEKNV